MTPAERPEDAPMMTRTLCPHCGDVASAVRGRIPCEACAAVWARSVEGAARALGRMRVSRWPQMAERARWW